MMLYPEVQRKAQTEVDRVIGSDRLPTLADRSSLPYVGALVQEVLRWNPVAPLGKFAVFRSHGLLFPSVPRRLSDDRGATRCPTCYYQGRRLQGVFHSQGNPCDCKHLVSEKRNFLVEVLFCNLFLPR